MLETGPGRAGQKTRKWAVIKQGERDKFGATRGTGLPVVEAEGARKAARTFSMGRGGTAQFPPGGVSPQSDRVLDLSCLESRSGISLWGTRVNSGRYTPPAVDGPVLHGEDEAITGVQARLRATPSSWWWSEVPEPPFFWILECSKECLAPFTAPASPYTPPSPAGSPSD